MNLNLDTMDAEPAADPPVEVTPTEPAAAPSPPIEAAAAAPAAPVTPAVTEPKHEVIPLATHLEQRKQLNARIAELEAEKSARAAPTPPAAASPVDFMEDPKGYVDQTVKGAISKADANAAELQALREQAQITSLISEAGQAEAAFAKDHPDYEQALDHVRSTRMAQLRLMDSEATEAQLQQVIAREEIVGIAAAKQRGINPAELAFNYAKTLGYKSPEPKPAAAAVPAAAAPATLATAAADVSAARSLGAGGGGGDSGGDEEESELTSALKARFRR